MYSTCDRLFVILFNKMISYNQGISKTGFGTMNKPPPHALKTVYVTLPARTTVKAGEGGVAGGGGGKAVKSKKRVYKEVRKSTKKHKRKHSRTLKRKHHRASKKKSSTISKSKIINF